MDTRQAVQDLKTLGSRMRAARDRAGLSRAQVAAAISAETGERISDQTVLRWETGAVNAPVSRIYQFARAVDCDPAILMCPPPVGVVR